MLWALPIYEVLSCLLCILPLFFYLKKLSIFINHAEEVYPVFANFILFLNLKKSLYLLGDTKTPKKVGKDFSKLHVSQYSNLE